MKVCVKYEYGTISFKSVIHPLHVIPSTMFLHKHTHTHTYDHLRLLHFCLHAQLRFYSFVIRYWKSHFLYLSMSFRISTCISGQLNVSDKCWLSWDSWAFLNYDLWNAQSTKIFGARYFFEKFGCVHVSILVNHWGSQIVIASIHKPDGMVCAQQTNIPHVSTGVIQWIYKDQLLFYVCIASEHLNSKSTIWICVMKCWQHNLAVFH